MIRMAGPRERHILRTHVPALFPESGPVWAILYGEAPGPLGADQSGIPFWGDRSGRLVYRALVAAGMAEVPEAAWASWDGAELARRGLRPRLDGVALSNARPSCPTSDGQRFRAPSQGELKDPENVARIAAELSQAAARCPAPLPIITLGRRAGQVLEAVARTSAVPPIVLHHLAHPSAQALLSTAPEFGRGLRMVDLEARWEAALVALLQAARPG
jgi:uracil-DNA glycosylase